MSEIVHLAGPQIEFDGVQRQRCVWCGGLIEERDLCRMDVQVDQTASAEVQQEEARRAVRSGWRGFVAVTGSNPVVKWAVVEPEDGRAPERSCMRMSDPPNVAARERRDNQ